jgi:hypothetical protein
MDRDLDIKYEKYKNHKTIKSIENSNLSIIKKALKISSQIEILEADERFKKNVKKNEKNVNNENKKYLNTIRRKYTQKNIRILSNSDDMDILQDMLKNSKKNKVVPKIKKDYKNIESKIKEGSDEIAPNNLNVTINYRFLFGYEQRLRNAELKYVGENNYTNIIKKMRDRAQKIIESWEMDEPAPDKLTDYYIDNIIDNNGKYIFKYTTNGIIEVTDEEFVKVENNNKKIRSMMILRDSNPINISNMFDCIDLNKSDINCVVNAISKRCTKKEARELENILEKHEDINAKQLYDNCVKYNRNCVLYDISGNILYQNKSEQRKHCKKLYFLCYNEHLYVLDNTYENSKKSVDECDIKNVSQEKLDKKFMNLIENKILPTEIKFYNGRINQFINDNTIYFVNDNYKAIHTYLKKFGLEDKITINTKISNVMKIIENKYIECSHKSFFPFDFTKQACSYVNPNVDYNKKMKSIDGIKFYSQCLSDLPYLIYCDFKTASIKLNPTEIVDHYLYKVNTSDSILTPSNGVYWGRLLILAKNNGVKIDLLEEIETTTMPNHYTEIINDIYNEYDEDIHAMYNEGQLKSQHMAKDIVNRYIGLMKGDNSIRKSEEITDYIPEKELDYETNILKLKICNGIHHFKYNVSDVSCNINNNYPINIQIKDFSNIRLAEKINELNIKNNDIVAIFTDNIIYYENDHINKFEDCKYWKEIKVDIDKIKNFTCPNFEGINDGFSFTKPNYESTNAILVDSYAGSGKSTYIKNKIIPKLNDNYIVLTPSHSTLESYKCNYNANVIQLYTNTNKIPSQKNIIVDEYGMMDRKGWALLIKCSILKKNIFCYGDRRQLAPVGEEFKELSDHFLKSFFKKIHVCEANYRNNIPRNIYETAMNERLNKKEIENLVDKYCNNKNANVYIGICKNTVFKKNLEILKNNGQYTGEIYDCIDKCDQTKFEDMEDTNVICKTNHYGKLGLYNNFPAKIVSFDNNVVLEYTVYEEDEKTKKNISKQVELKIKKKIFFKRFVFGYAINLHAYQGCENEKIQFLKDDMRLLVHPRSLYTLISRFKEKLSKEQMNNNTKCDYDVFNLPNH